MQEPPSSLTFHSTLHGIRKSTSGIDRSEEQKTLMTQMSLELTLLGEFQHLSAHVRLNCIT